MFRTIFLELCALIRKMAAAHRAILDSDKFGDEATRPNRWLDWIMHSLKVFHYITRWFHVERPIFAQSQACLTFLHDNSDDVSVLSRVSSSVYSVQMNRIPMMFRQWKLPVQFQIQSMKRTQLKLSRIDNFFCYIEFQNVFKHFIIFPFYKESYTTFQNKQIWHL